MRIAIVGPYPPPYGGISIHIQRLEGLLQADSHTPVVFRNTSAKRWLLENWNAWSDFDVIHFHDISWKNRVLIGLLGFLGLPVILTIHGDSLGDQLSGVKCPKRPLLGFAIKHIAHVIGVKAEIRDLLLSLGASPSRVSVINAYVPPILEDPVVFSEEIQSIVDAHSPLIVANGFGIVPISESNDLYGVGLTLDLCAKLIEEHPQLGCIFFLAQVGNQERHDWLLKKRSELGLDDCFHLILGQEFAPILTQATLFIRPTYRDGFGVSVSEALYFGVPAIASDVCDRENGAILFRSGSLDALYQQAQRVLCDYQSGEYQTRISRPVSSYNRIVEVYAAVAGRG